MALKQYHKLGGHLVGMHLDGLGDVSASSPSDGDSLVWDNTNAYWKNSAVAGTGYSTAANFSSLPAAADHSGEIYVVLAAEGAWFLTRKKAGMYRSDGSSWNRLTNALDIFNATVFRLYDNADNTKLVGWDVSAITTSTTRTITMPDANVDLSTAGDGKIKIDAAATAGYLGAAIGDGVLRFTANEFTLADGGDYVTLSLADHATARTALGLAIGTDVLAEQTIGIADDNLLEVDGSPNSGEYARFTANGLEGRTEAEFKADFNLQIGTDVLAEQTIGIADDNLVEVDDADAADNDFAKFTANGLEGRSYAEVRTDLGLVIGTNVLAEQTIGIADNNLVEIDGADIADNEYARFTANGLESRTAAEVTADLSAATTTAQGPSELATAAEVTTGTDTGRTICPDALAGSTIFGTKTVILKVVADDTAPVAGDGKAHFTIPAELNGMNLVTVGAHVYTASGASGPVTVMIHNLTDTSDMLSTAITIDDTELDSATAGTAAVINASEDDVVTADVLRIDVDDIGDSATRGLEIRMGFRLP